MKKVLVFTSTFPRFTDGDATPPFVYELSRRLVSDELDITILTPRVPRSKIYEERDGLKIYRYPYFFREKWETLNDGAILPNLKANKWLYLQVPFLIFSWLIHLIRIMRREKIDTIHAHWIIPQGFLAVLYKRLWDKSIRIICTTHGGDIFWLRGKLWTAIKKYTLEHIDHLTVVSHAIKSECLKLGISEEKISVIPMWVDTELFSPDKYDESIREKYQVTGKLLLFVGRLAEKKWVQYLIDAMPWVIEKYPDTKLLIIWHGPLEWELQHQTHNLKLDENIIFLGAISNSDLPRYYATADIFVWPSIIATSWDREWLPVTYIEAISSGCILLWTDLEWNKDIIIEWENWFFIKQNDDEGITKRILEIFEDDNFDREKARKTVRERFGWHIISSKYLYLLKKTNYATLNLL